MTAWSTTPELTDGEIDELLVQDSLADAEGNSPESEEWEPTYDLDAAAAAGWVIKAGRAVSSTETEPDSVNVSSRVFENCMRMSREFSRKRSTTLKV
jgi:hypothetical protein